MRRYGCGRSRLGRIAMNTPICDFVEGYARSNSLRLHMPGHKGEAVLGPERLDITEIEGADSLYEADGIIAESELNASRLFGCATYYSTEGASHCIRAMLYLVLLHAKQRGAKPFIAAGRNAHKSFLSGAALLDFEIDWLYPEGGEGYLSCNITAQGLEKYLQTAEEKPAAIYLTSPDYLGRIVDIATISKVCREWGILLIVDNAHGAYLRFLPESRHPIDLGADICCDSAHKTLPVLTGGAYLHLSDRMAHQLGQNVKGGLALFGSTSPSYLILQSLDAANVYLEGLPRLLEEFLPTVEKLKAKLARAGHTLYGDEPLKITLATKDYGYLGNELAKLLSDKGIECEFSDGDFLVMMLTPQTCAEGIEKIEQALLSIERRKPISDPPPPFSKKCRRMGIRNAALSPAEVLPVKDCVGRVAATPSVGCPPAVPIVVCGEEIDENALRCFEYYGIKACSVVKE